MVDSRIVKNKYGYYEVEMKPSEEELGEYYARKYYQLGKGSYDEKGYSEEEAQYFHNKMAQKHLAAKALSPLIASGEAKTFLDVGAGECWGLSYFAGQGWDCVGVDFSEHGCLKNNPDQRDSLLCGDIYKNLRNLAEEGRTFDLILLDNVLEHVIEPLQLLEQIKSMLNDGGVFVCEVPNDYSKLQQCLLARGDVAGEYWVTIPDHLSYFNKEGLIALSKEAGWQVDRVICDYPIDFNLINPNSNYAKTPTLGKSCHNERVALENLFHSISPEKTNAMYEAMADLGLGRVITAFMTKQ